MLKCSLIITTYNNVDFLGMTLKSLLHQSHFPDEVLIADDGSGDETRLFIEQYKNSAPFDVQHIWHEDKGFRAGMIRNKAIAASRFDFIIIIDGDLVLHKDFIADYLVNAEPGTYLQGNRLRLSDEQTRRYVKQSKTSYSIFELGIDRLPKKIHSRLLSRIATITSEKPLSISSCSQGHFKKDIIAVNGFNDDFVGWGCEDSELLLRLINRNVKCKFMKFCAIAYHLDHPHRKNEEQHARNIEIEEETRRSKKTYCENGINKYL